MLDPTTTSVTTASPVDDTEYTVVLSEAAAEALADIERYTDFNFTKADLLAMFVEYALVSYLGDSDCVLPLDL